jgi:hypothetical protein
VHWNKKAQHLLGFLFPRGSLRPIGYSSSEGIYSLR